MNVALDGSPKTQNIVSIADWVFPSTKRKEDITKKLKDSLNVVYEL